MTAPSAELGHDLTDNDTHRTGWSSVCAAFLLPNAGDVDDLKQQLRADPRMAPFLLELAQAAARFFGAGSALSLLADRDVHTMHGEVDFIVRCAPSAGTDDEAAFDAYDAFVWEWMSQQDGELAGRISLVVEV